MAEAHHAATSRSPRAHAGHAIFNHHAILRRRATGRRGGQVHIRPGLGARHILIGKHPPGENLRQTQAPHLRGQFKTRGIGSNGHRHTCRGKGTHRFHRAWNGQCFFRHAPRDQRRDFLPPFGRQQPDARFDAGQHIGQRHTQKCLPRFGCRHGPATQSHFLRDNAIHHQFSVGQDAIAIKQDGGGALHASALARAGASTRSFSCGQSRCCFGHCRPPPKEHRLRPDCSAPRTKPAKDAMKAGSLFCAGTRK